MFSPSRMFDTTALGLLSWLLELRLRSLIFLSLCVSCLCVLVSEVQVKRLCPVQLLPKRGATPSRRTAAWYMWGSTPRNTSLPVYFLLSLSFPLLLLLLFSCSESYRGGGLCGVPLHGAVAPGLSADGDRGLCTWTAGLFDPEPAHWHQWPRPVTPSWRHSVQTPGWSLQAE